MTYLQYHLVFIVPLLLVLAVVTARRRGALAGPYQPDDRHAWMGYWALPVIAFLYTTPWDNYLVFREVWTYPPDRVLGRIGYVPYEEYAFFILQTLITGLFLLWLLRRDAAGQGQEAVPRRDAALVRWGGAAFLMGLSLLGAWCLRSEQSLYLGLILAWAMPVLAGQWAFGGDLVMRRARVYWTAVLIPTAYLWLTDAVAISQGIWAISDRYTLGPGVGPLPLEEMAFFLITNLLVVTGVMLFLHRESLPRVQGGLRWLTPWLGVTILAFLLRIPVPLWPAGFPLLATLSTGLLTLAAWLFVARHAGAARATGMAVLGVTLGWAVEKLGSVTGWPFGVYSYDGAPGPLLGGVPLLVPLGWFAMPVVTTLLARGRAWLSGLLLAAWDAGLEPLMTGHGFWTWADPRPLWSGAPLLNFLGWWAVGTGLAWLFTRLAPLMFTRPERPSPALAFGLEVFFLPGGLLLLGQPGAALGTLLLMGAAGLLTRALAERRGRGATRPVVTR